MFTFFFTSGVFSSIICFNGILSFGGIESIIDFALFGFIPLGDLAVVTTGFSKSV